jgi:hypothetical protein
MYACMTGQLPFQAQTMEKLMDLVCGMLFVVGGRVGEAPLPGIVSGVVAAKALTRGVCSG